MKSLDMDVVETLQILIDMYGAEMVLKGLEFLEVITVEDKSPVDVPKGHVFMGEVSSYYN